jgi:predicted transglutaminase-like cysteine proteinase
LHHGVTPAHLTGVTVSMRVMSAGDGYQYLLQSVAAGDGHRPLTTPLGSSGRILSWATAQAAAWGKLPDQWFRRVCNPTVERWS